MKQAIITIISTILLTLSTVWMYRTQTEILGRSQSMDVLSKHGQVNINGDVLVFTHNQEIPGYTTNLLQALEKQADYYHVFIEYY